VAVAYIEAPLPNFPGRAEETHEKPQYTENMSRDLKSAPSKNKIEKLSTSHAVHTLCGPTKPPNKEYWG
jgi:hypothetical protein